MEELHSLRTRILGRSGDEAKRVKGGDTQARASSSPGGGTPRPRRRDVERRHRAAQPNIDMDELNSLTGRRRATWKG